MRTLVELLHVLIGLGATALVVAAATWAYPLARAEVEVSGWVIAGIIVLLGIGPVRRAWQQDRGHG